MVYDFDEQNAKGDAGEQYLDRLFAATYDFQPAVPEEQRNGIDRVFTHRQTKRRLTVEYKTDYERTSALTPDQLSDLTGRPRTILYQRLGILERELGWLRIDRADRQLILRPLVGRMSQDHHPQDLQRQPAPTARSPASAPVNKELQQVLESVGIENPARNSLARNRDLDPSWVHAWHL